jgi:hypothetical protein
VGGGLRAKGPGGGVGRGATWFGARRACLGAPPPRSRARHPIFCVQPLLCLKPPFPPAPPAPPKGRHRHLPRLPRGRGLLLHRGRALLPDQRHRHCRGYRGAPAQASSRGRWPAWGCAAREDWGACTPTRLAPAFTPAPLSLPPNAGLPPQVLPALPGAAGQRLLHQRWGYHHGGLGRLRQLGGSSAASGRPARRLRGARPTPSACPAPPPLNPPPWQASRTRASTCPTRCAPWWRATARATSPTSTSRWGFGGGTGGVGVGQREGASLSPPGSGLRQRPPPATATPSRQSLGPLPPTHPTPPPTPPPPGLPRRQRLHRRAVRRQRAAALRRRQEPHLPGGAAGQGFAGPEAAGPPSIAGLLRLASRPFSLFQNLSNRSPPSSLPSLPPPAHVLKARPRLPRRLLGRARRRRVRGAADRPAGAVPGALSRAFPRRRPRCHRAAPAVPSVGAFTHTPPLVPTYRQRPPPSPNPQPQEELSPLNIYNILEECHHGPHVAPSRAAPSAASAASSLSKPAANAAAAEARRRERAARAAALGARYSEVLRSHRGWPVTGALPKRGTAVRNWAHLLGGLGHNPPCTGAPRARGARGRPTRWPALPALLAVLGGFQGPFNSPARRHPPPPPDASEGDVWLNSPAVRRALHAAPIDVVGAPWTVCRCGRLGFGLGPSPRFDGQGGRTHSPATSQPRNLARPTPPSHTHPQRPHLLHPRRRLHDLDPPGDDAEAGWVGAGGGGGRRDGAGAGVVVRGASRRGGGAAAGRPPRPARTLTPCRLPNLAPSPPGLRALIYSGDHDMAVPHTGSEAWCAAADGEAAGRGAQAGGLSLATALLPPPAGPQPAARARKPCPQNPPLPQGRTTWG